MTSAIKGFFGDNRWLSNMVIIEKFVYDNIEFNSTENFYQAMKFLDKKERLKISKMTSRESKNYAKKLKKMGFQRKDWANIKVDIMTFVNNIKYSQEPFGKLLLGTGDVYIEETNTWKDTFWGVFDGGGENNLGKILMDIRDKLNLNIDLEQENIEFIKRKKSNITLVVNRRLEKEDVYIGRGSPYGNPYPTHNGEFTTEDSLNCYQYDFEKRISKDPEYKALIHKLEGKKLGCYCKKLRTTDPSYAEDKTRCHGDTISNYLNKKSPEKKY